MRSLWFGVLVCAAFFVACGDDDSSFATRPSDGSSLSSKKQGDGGSEAAMTSSSAKSSSSVKSSSSSAKSSDSVAGCKTEMKDDCEYGKLKDDRDGQTYKIVKIGDQWWMAENLNYEVDSSFCYNDSAEYCEKYGRLYRWAAAVGKSESECGYDGTCSLPTGSIQGVCPSGWHLPRKYEWETLFNAVDGQSTAGRVLKSTSGWESNGNGTDSFGFSALPAGYREKKVDYYNEGGLALFWSSTENISFSAYYMGLDFNHDDAGLNYDDKNSEFSVRCLKD